MSDNLSLTPKQSKAVTLLISGASHDQTANVIGCSPRTITRWLNQAPFVAEMLMQRYALRNDVLNQLHLEGKNAADVIVALMTNEKVSPRVRLDAAKDILDRVIGQQQIDELTDKVSTLERLINEQHSY